MTRATQRWAVVASLLLLVLGASACSSSPSGQSGSTSTSSATGGGSTTSTPSASASRADIKQAFGVLFDLANPAVTPKLAVVQDGTALKGAFVKELKSSLAKRATGAKVTAVAVKSGNACQTEALSSPCALVTYDILGKSGTVLLANSKGFAVYVAPKWLVSKTTICTLLTLANGNAAPSGC